ncbi:hypothetical protein [Aeromicrobium sp.]|uniref:hypothetical protein n=1 Tax=Aeromicrobium sp. TaxID=1871063 RepID=UPI0030BBC917
MRSTIVRRFGAAISVSALALSLGTVPSSAAESPQPFGAASKATEGPRDGRLATGADLQGATSTTSRSSSSAEIMATAANVVEIPAHSAVVNNPLYNYIDIDEIWVSASTNTEVIDGFELKLSVDGVSRGYFPVYYDDIEDVLFVEIPDTIGLGKSLFTATRVNYTEESGQTPTIDGTNSNYFYVRRDIDERATAEYSLSPSGYTKTFNISSMGIYSPSIDSFRALSSIKLQYKTSDGWKTKKTLYPDADTGSASYSFGRTTKFYYRIISSRTSTWVGFTKTFPKI